MIGHVTTSEATNEAIGYVMGRLWERGERELEVLGLSRDRAIEAAVVWRDSGCPTMAWMVNDIPVFFVILVPTSPGVVCTTFQATEEFTRYQREITRTLRTQLKEYALAHGLREVEIYSACTHPRASAWFRVLGFELDVNRMAPPAHVKAYRFVRRFAEGGDVLRQS